ncbi:hypothetical protein SORBI_3008G031350, partial [Sorghum bicolor]
VSVILNLELLHSNRSIVHTRLKSTSDTSEPTIFCGRHVEKAKIMDIITGDWSSHYDLTVLPIVGLGGMGKTTLAQHIYNKEAETYFDVRIWACVSTDFSVPRLLKDILESKSLHELSKGLTGTPEKQIEQILTSKRFLLVLDDMWDTVNNDGWDRLLAPFRKGQTKGNMILVTTRSPSVAQIVKVKTTDSTIELEGLDQVAFREFFQSCVFGDDNKSKDDHKELDDIGEEIMKKLKGSPLAAKTVGRLLRNNLDQNHWKRVLDSKEWELQTGDTDIMPALKLSYDFLPFHLQHCFSYCALFPEDYRFTSQQLIHWWTGLGILQPGPQNRSLEEIGQTYLDDLINHGFIKKDTISSTDTEYSIHDLLHDLGLKVASRECLSLNSSNVVPPAEIWPSVRHLSIILDSVDDGKIADFISGLRELVFGRRLKIDNLQTLMVFGKLDENFTDFLGYLIKKASSLRVVNLENMQSRMEFPTLCHLRYLRLGCKRDLWLGLEPQLEIHLPSMLSRFYHLRILDLQEWNGFKSHLPRDVSNLTKLSHFDVWHHDFHPDICNVGKLHLLQELNKFEVRNESTGFELKELGKLNKLRELGIYALERINTKEEAAEAKLIEKQWLQKLELVWSRSVPGFLCDGEGLVLEGLRTPRNLQSLRIVGHGSHSGPTWLGSKQHSPKALQLLYLKGVNWELLKELGPGYFAKTLKSLTLIGLTGLESWVPGDHGHLLSSLEKLQITECSPLVSGYPLVSLFIQHSPILSHLVTDDLTGALAVPTCSILSSSLSRLILSGSEGVKSFTEQQEDVLVLLTSLQYLKLDYFPSLLCLPAGLHKLGNLKTLEISCCSSLRSLPENGLPSSLQEFISREDCFHKRCIEELNTACKNYTRDHPGIKLQFLEDNTLYKIREWHKIRNLW